MKVRFDLRKKFFPSGFTADYELDVAMDRHAIPDLVDRAINGLLPAEATRRREVTDLKGRDPQSLLDPATPAEHLPRGEELVFVAGRVFTDDSQLAAGKLSDPLRGESFEMRLSTVFKQFSGHHHIVHSTTLERGGARLDGIDVSEVGRAAPVVISRFRLGMELFRSRFMAGALGYTPTVSDALMLEASGESLRVRIWAEAMKNRSDLPLSRDGLFDKVSSLVKDITGFDIAADYRSKSAG